jgi:hypothetical protein
MQRDFLERGAWQRRFASQGCAEVLAAARQLVSWSSSVAKGTGLIGHSEGKLRNITRRGAQLRGTSVVVSVSRLALPKYSTPH